MGEAMKGKVAFVGVTSLLAVIAIALIVASPAPALARGSSSPCPEASALQRPERPRGAIPAAKAALGGRGRVLEVSRGPGSTYAAVARRECGVEVLRDSVYVVVHPVGMTCAACDLHAYVVELGDGTWKVWTAY